ncbi:MAG: sugar ABC transporter permease [Bacillota bacterium]
MATLPSVRYQVTSKGQAVSAWPTRRDGTWRVWPVRVAAVAVTVLSLLPTLYVLAVSFKAGEAFYTSSLIPRQFTLDNYSRLLTTTGFKRWAVNSLILGGVGGAASTLIAALAGYAFSRLRFPGRRYGILTLLLVQMLPTSVSIVAIYRILLTVGLLNTLQGLLLLYGLGGSAFAVWLLKNYIDSIPRELDESAYVDGATPWQAFWRITFPLVQPMLAAQFIFSFIGIFNDYMAPSLYLTSPELYPLGVGIKIYVAGQYQANWTAFAAASVLSSLPILAIFFLAQRLLVEGLTRGALKG